MTIRLKCPGCNNVLTVKDEMAGRVGKCPACQTAIKVPQPTAAASAPPAQQAPARPTAAAPPAQQAPARPTAAPKAQASPAPAAAKSKPAPEPEEVEEVEEVDQPLALQHPRDPLVDRDIDAAG